jgi:hypothetical protein
MAHVQPHGPGVSRDRLHLSARLTARLHLRFAARRHSRLTGGGRTAPSLSSAAHDSSDSQDHRGSRRC